MELFLYTALFSPLVGSLFAALFGASPKTKIAGIVPSALLGVSLISSTILLILVFTTGHTLHVEMMTWMATGDLYIPFGFVVDQVSVVMMMVVTLVSTVVHVYAIGYMDHDKGFNRFFSYLSAFVFSMMILVMSDNFAGLFIGWEGVGLCSWLLIGFWYHKESASWAANEAFIMNRIADLGMLIGIFLVYWNTGTLQYDGAFAAMPSLDTATITWIGIFLFIGAMGKSAQFPLHTWLADAMEGPTPVSALIHAATMVTAGVYLVVRSSPLYELIPNVGLFIASLGAFVALFAASMALVNRDMKRVIAYSTLSQLGYMFAAAGLGAYWVALFHLMAHAFFKALLFLGAGNVMHAMHDELDPFKMGGLNKVMKGTFLMMTIASVALAGIFPLAGFFSKDLILEVAFVNHHYVIYAVLLFTAALTAFYSFRLVALIFHGEERYKLFGIHPHEAYKFMLIAMSPLLLLAIIAGAFKAGYFEMVTQLLPSTEYHVHSAATYWIMTIGTQLLVALAIFYAYKKYTKKDIKVPDGTSKMENSFVYKLLINQYYIPYFYEQYIVKAYRELSEVFWTKIDQKIVDGTVDGMANILYKTGNTTRVMQSGNLSTMLKWMVAGTVALLSLAVVFGLAARYSGEIKTILSGLGV
ncbi:NADH-plastoquinone oxidoreductase, chain 5 [Sulfurimonas denitrificans DSM 1251]|uniref:NADH-plastoquinone oxidoreductase, chain 5 n=1 Tax=Sulfurimonas denitrificans (strain ATCC 33889 / DSM 1251) TaxID=326298 RepID=Q30PJ0_SULDN|nr:NADH-quinone oxidoreductase subunit L [Sulfurimonas denitrificans]ABB45091.1 NADH-plastoquinone oxidoreductase, chain 5 [Sulfurimonas denitrificans DSM 1251]MDD3442149.1 NADH-quinone oxidoreductase subunit L [Sulfurimonas denitrificans]